MSKAALLGIMAVMLVALVSPGWIGAQQQSISLEHSDVFKGLQRPPVTFSHEKHIDVYPNCVECHHIYEVKNGKKANVWSGEAQTCSECHKLEQEGSKAPLMTAFHENCTGCHRDLTKDGKKSGPVTCGECHVRSR